MLVLERSIIVWFALCVLVLSACTGLDSEPEAQDRDVDLVDALGCDRETIGNDDGSLVSAMAVDDGAFVGLCFGSPDDRLDDVWEILSSITPDAVIDDIDLVAGFDQPDGDTLAFASMIGEGNDRFVIAVNLAKAAEDPDELRLTLAHEVSHVFSQTPDQLDVDGDESDCDTFFNGNGCLLPGSYVMAWLDRFWTEDDLASLGDPGVPDEAGGDERCDLNREFLGPYAASHPEEDFAESFSAYVFDLDVDPSVQPKLDFFDDYPELVAFRDQVAALGEPAPANTFDLCG